MSLDPSTYIPNRVWEHITFTYHGNPNEENISHQTGKVGNVPAGRGYEIVPRRVFQAGWFGISWDDGIKNRVQKK